MSHLKLGHVHLKVSSLSRAVEFYTGILGLKVTEEVSGIFAFLSSSELHHELALQQVGEGAPAPSPRSLGLYHVAFEVADRQALARMYRKIRDNNIHIIAVDHRISWALYFSDPDGNGLEIYTDMRSQPGGARMWEGKTRELTPAEILAHEG